MPLNLIAGHVFRANPNYELIRFDLLPPGEQETLRGLTEDPGFYGILVCRGSGSTRIMSACRNTAKLLQSLAKAGPILPAMFDSDEEDLRQSIAALVLDGVLEVSHERGFVSGPEASTLLLDKGEAAFIGESQGYLQRLSRAALEYGQALQMDDASRLAKRLYLYNAMPLTSKWEREYPSAEAVARLMGIRPDGNSKLRGWNAVEPKMQNYPWFEWSSPSARVRDAAGQGYKLYVSPHPGSLPEVFRTVVEALDESETYALKVGRDAANLVRPDKFMIYFRDFVGLERMAARVMPALRGCAVQGVPFTAALDDTGLLSWGVDPLPEKGRLAWEGPESWRSWITGRLGAALVSAQRQGSGGLEPWQFALERLSLEKVDTETWAPSRGFGLAVA